MVALIRLILRLFKKEQLLLSKYQKGHPRFFWFIALDALLSSALVFGGFQFIPLVFADTYSQREAESSGLKAMTAAEIISHRTCEGFRGFWLGAKPGSEYTLDCQKQGVFTVTYLPQGTSDLFDFDKPKLTIQTFSTFSDMTAHRNFGLDFNGFGLLDSKGDHIYFADAAEIIELGASHEWVFISYPTALSQAALVKDASELTLL